MLVEISGVNDMRIKLGQRGDALAPALPEHLALDRGGIIVEQRRLDLAHGYSARNGRVISEPIASSTLDRPVEHGGHGGDDRHVDVVLLRHVRQDRSGESAFGQFGCLLRVFRRHAFAEHKPERVIARLRRWSR